MDLNLLSLQMRAKQEQWLLKKIIIDYLKIMVNKGENEWKLEK